MLKLLLVKTLQVQVALLERYCSSRDTNLHPQRRQKQQHRQH
jgi:hypothetical protein